MSRDGEGRRPGATSEVDGVLELAARGRVMRDNIVIEGLAVLQAVLSIALALVLRELPEGLFGVCLLAGHLRA